ncbi:unnamed protein product [Chrysoparadoxa australica]
MANEECKAACIGSGRFLRAVLVPALHEAGIVSFIAQPRGSSFQEALKRSDDLSYEVDTVERDGSTSTAKYPTAGACSLATQGGRETFLGLAKSLRHLQVIGLGLTEAGISAESPAIKLWSEFLHERRAHYPLSSISVINTDNVPSNGDVLTRILRELNAGDDEFLSWADNFVVVHNTMVDRITSHREGDNLVPKAEPPPVKALVIEDLRQVLPAQLAHVPGVVVRHKPGQINVDHALKLRVANGTHTAMVHVMALSGLRDTSMCIEHPLLLRYLEELFRCDIEPAAMHDLGVLSSEVRQVWDDWFRRLCHPHFGLSTMFITQNAWQKLSIRLLPSVMSCQRMRRMPSPFMAFAVAALLRFITHEPKSQPGTGRLDGAVAGTAASGAEAYTPGLHVDWGALTYEFVESRGSQLLAGAGALAVGACLSEACLDCRDDPVGKQFVKQVQQLYGRMVEGEAAMGVLQSLMPAMKTEPAKVALKENEVREVVTAEVMQAEAVDLHTHLFPPSHHPLMLWGIDDLLTYHYLVAEFFMTAEGITPEAFYALPKKEQSDLIWQALFVDRSPVSEAARGVLTTLQLLGLEQLAEARDIHAIRLIILSFALQWYALQDPDDFCELVFHISRVKYCIMTNIPFEASEATHWRPKAKKYSKRFRSALRVDPLLKGDWKSIAEVLAREGFPQNLAGAQDYIRGWVDTMKPEYLMASTPSGFTLPPSPCPASSSPDLLQGVLAPLAEELSLPLVLKLGAHRAVNPALGAAGDGVEVADVGVLRELCTRFPKVKFMATFLSRVNQHEAAVLANKFPNLHLYGCWWYCNVPSIIREITACRVELLGTAFTAQHSDARVLDQLLYKWNHSRHVICQVLAEQYVNLVATGWGVTREEIRRDVGRLFGGAYEEFLAKELT